MKIDEKSIILIVRSSILGRETARIRNRPLSWNRIKIHWKNNFVHIKCDCSNSPKRSNQSTKSDELEHFFRWAVCDFLIKMKRNGKKSQCSSRICIRSLITTMSSSSFTRQYLFSNEIWFLTQAANEWTIRSINVSVDWCGEKIYHRNWESTKNKRIKNEKSKRFWWEDLFTRCRRVTMFEIIIQQWKKIQKEEKALTDLIFYQLTFPTLSHDTEGSRWCRRACVQKNETTCSDILNYISTCIDWVHVKIADRVCFVR